MDKVCINCKTPNTDEYPFHSSANTCFQALMKRLEMLERIVNYDPEKELEDLRRFHMETLPALMVRMRERRGAAPALVDRWIHDLGLIAEGKRPGAGLPPGYSGEADAAEQHNRQLLLEQLYQVVVYHQGRQLINDEIGDFLRKLSDAANAIKHLEANPVNPPGGARLVRPGI